MTDSTDRVLPQRVAGLVARDLGDEIIILDPRTDAVHSLTGRAAEAWHASGDRTSALPAELASSIVELQRLGVLVDGDGMSRRSLLKRGSALAAATGIATIALPQMAAHASTNTYDIYPDFVAYAGARPSGTTTSNSTGRFSYSAGAAYTANVANSPTTYTAFTRFQKTTGTLSPYTAEFDAGTAAKPLAGITATTTDGLQFAPTSAVANVTNFQTGSGVAAGFIAPQTGNVTGTVTFTATTNKVNAEVALYTALGTLITSAVLPNGSASAATLNVGTIAGTAGQVAFYIVVRPITGAAASGNSATDPVKVTSAIVA